MTIRHAPFFVLALPIVIITLELAGASALVLLSALALLAAPMLALLLLPADRAYPPGPDEYTP